MITREQKPENDDPAESINRKEYEKKQIANEKMIQ